jgi:hypothetical protein
MAAIHNIICTAGHETLNVVLPFGSRPPCHCGAATDILWSGRAAGVVDDSIPGGVFIRHGLCWPDGTPRRYDSHTEMRAEAKRRGFTNHVEHIGERGSDKSKHTVRWV